MLALESPASAQSIEWSAARIALQLAQSFFPESTFIRDDANAGRGPGGENPPDLRPPDPLRQTPDVPGSRDRCARICPPDDPDPGEITAGSSFKEIDIVETSRISSSYRAICAGVRPSVAAFVCSSAFFAGETPAKSDVRNLKISRNERSVFALKIVRAYQSGLYPTLKRSHGPIARRTAPASFL